MCRHRIIWGVLTLLVGYTSVHAQLSNSDPQGNAAENTRSPANAPEIAPAQMMLPPTPTADQPQAEGTESYIIWSDGQGCAFPPGRVWGGAEYLLWWTKGSPLPPLLTTSPPGTPVSTAGVLGEGGTSIVFGDQLVNSGVRSGGRFNLGGWLNESQTTGIEGNFFSLGGAASHFNASSDGSTILARPFVNEDPTSADFGKNDSLFIGFPGLVKGSFQASTTSRLLGTEVYLRQALCCRNYCRLDLIAGYRFLQLREGLQLSETEISTDPTNPLFSVPFVINEGFDTRNDFHGGELGLMGEYQRNRLFVRAVGKVALGSTGQIASIHGTTQVGGAAPETGGFLALPSNIGQYQTSAFSVVPEVGINLGYVIAPKIRAYTGYSLLYWSQVARPGDQVDLRVNSSQPPIGSGLVGESLPAFRFRDSDFWAQGINFGLEFRY